jgi:hypothetical protein
MRARAISTAEIFAEEAEAMSDWNNAVDGAVSTGFAPANEITVLFDDSIVTFPMPTEATLADLAGRLTEEGAPQRRQMLAVTIKMGSAKSLHNPARSREGHIRLSSTCASRHRPAAKCQRRDKIF